MIQNELPISNTTTPTLSFVKKIFLVIFKHVQLLHSYLSSLSQLSDGQALVKNFRSLLQFWKRHYTLPMKETDRKNLEQVRNVFAD